MSLARPYITLAYAQSLDGSLTLEAGRPTALSGPEAMRFTHQLRATHDAILVGIGTVLADNPRLTVRYGAGPHPQPIVLDSALRFPLTANVLQHPTQRVWILTTEAASLERADALQAVGAQVVRLPQAGDGRVSLGAALEYLVQMGVQRLMVEGGAGVITTFWQARCCDHLALTIAPRILGGLRAVQAPLDLSLANVTYRPLGADLIVEADLRP